MSGVLFSPSPKFRFAYEGLLMKLQSKQAMEEVNERTGEVIRAVGPVSFKLDLSSGLLPVCGVRKMFPKTAAAEVAWFLKGDRSVAFIKQFAPIWDKFVEDDGDTIAAAYGYRWRVHFGRDQIGDAVKALAANPSDRRIWINAWDPSEDGLGRPGRNVPCPVGFSLSILNGRLNSSLVLRSSDVFVGLPYDIMGHALLMQAMAVSIAKAQGKLLTLHLGELHVTLAHPHLYDKHRTMANDCLRMVPSDDTLYLPVWSIDQIAENPEAYVQTVASLASRIVQPGYHCRPEVIE